MVQNHLSMDEGVAMLQEKNLLSPSRASAFPFSAPFRSRFRICRAWGDA